MRLGGHAGASTASTWPSSTSATAPGVVQCVVDGADDLRSRVRGAGHRARCAAAPEGTRTPTWPPARSRCGTARSRCSPRPSRRPSRSATASTPTRRSACATATSTCAATACSATCGCGRRSTAPPPRHGRPGLHRDRDADAHRLDAGGRPRLRRARPACSPARSTPCPRARSCSSSSAWSAASTATTRSPAACGTRTCGPTASSSSPSSTPRPASSARTTCWASSPRPSSDRRRGRHRRPPGRRSGRMTWHDAMERFGSDKPDVRFGMELVELTDVFAATEFNAFKAAVRQGHPGARRRPTDPQPSSTTSPTRPSSWGAKGLVWMQVERRRRGRPRRWPSSSPTTRRPGWSRALEAEPGDLLLARGRRAPHGPPRPRRCCASSSAGRRSTRAGCTSCGSSTSRCSRASTTTGGPIPAHHPFTMPHPDDLDLLERRRRRRCSTCGRRPTTWCSTAGSWARAASGSTGRDVQRRIFELLGIDAEEAQSASSASCSTAFRYGAPPHAGFAFGIDRLVALLAGEENIREVIAFPKTQSGRRPAHRRAAADRPTGTSTSSASGSSPPKA